MERNLEQFLRTLECAEAWKSKNPHLVKKLIPTKKTVTNTIGKIIHKKLMQKAPYKMPFHLTETYFIPEAGIFPTLEQGLSSPLP